MAYLVDEAGMACEIESFSNINQAPLQAPKVTFQALRVPFQAPQTLIFGSNFTSSVRLQVPFQAPLLQTTPVLGFKN